MSWYTVGEIIVWLLIAAVLGGVLGWLLRGVLRPRIVEIERRVRPAAAVAAEPEPTPEPDPVAEAEPEPEPDPVADAEPEPQAAPVAPVALVEPPVTTGTIVTDVDVPQPKRAPSKKPMPTSRTPSRSAPRPEPEAPADARSRVIAIAKRTAGRGAVPKDDLVLVHGIGPKIARLLEDMDITSFRQVARLTDADVEDITAALEAFPGRIERDNWMGSARELHRETYGDDPLK